MRAVARLRFGTLALLSAVVPATGQPASPPMANACLAHVSEAASRSGLSPEIVLRVMLAESGGNARIVSVKGAMGCMQIMPATWAYVRARYNLGADPFDARRNMIGGAMYLAELATRYGMLGAIAAYNAGPGRYERYAAGTATLPGETIAYTARIRGGPVPALVPVVARWQEASFFLTRGTGPSPAEAPSRAARHSLPGTRVSLFPLVTPDQQGTAAPIGP